VVRPVAPADDDVVLSGLAVAIGAIGVAPALGAGFDGQAGLAAIVLGLGVAGRWRRRAR
jgi:hypothetical protein